MAQVRNELPTSATRHSKNSRGVRSYRLTNTILVGVRTATSKGYDAAPGKGLRKSLARFLHMTDERYIGLIKCVRGKR